MGNCFGKTSTDANFNGEGRTLGSQPARPPQNNSARAAAPPKITGPGRTLGASPGTDSEAPGAAAARAAEQRAKATQGRGKLGKQLDAQKSQSQTKALSQNAKDNLAARDADAAAEARNWN